MYWLDGELSTTLPLNDRALHYGDGCFTTARVISGQIDGVSQHRLRMQHACQTLQIALLDWERWQNEVEHAAETLQQGVLKSIITRGGGSQGYGLSVSSPPRHIVSTAGYPAHYLKLQNEGTTLSISPVRLGIQPLLAGIKHLNRLEQVLIKAQIEQSESDDAVVLDTDNYVVECCAANIFWRKGKQVFTPELNRAGVNGLMRQRIIRLLSISGSCYKLSQVQAPIGQLLQADEVLICNALMPLLSVNCIEQKKFSSRELYDYLLADCLRVEL